MYSETENGKVLTEELYTYTIEKSFYLHLWQNCFMEISFHSPEEQSLM